MDMSLEWTEAFSVGHDGLDEEHRRLMTGINDVCAAYRARKPRSHVRTLLLALEGETQKHLEHENAVMLEICADVERPRPTGLDAMIYKAIAEHITAHERSIEGLRTIMRAATPNSADAALHLCMELRQWFIDHAIKYDAHLKTIFQAI